MSRKQRRVAAKLSRTPNKRIAETVTPIGSPVTELLTAGLQHHQAGRLAEAEACYRRVLAIQPDHVDALYLLGYLARQIGRHDLAVGLITQAIKRNGRNPIYFSTLGLALQEQGNLDEAIAAYRQAIGIKPDDADSHYNLGVALQERGKRDEAASAYRQAISIKPDYAAAHSNLGSALKGLGKLDEAIAAYRQAIGIKPNYGEAHYNLGVALAEQNRPDEAIAAYRQAVAIKPDYTEAYYNLGNALQGRGKLDEAIAAYRRAIAIKPDYAEAHSNLGNALQGQSKLDEAIAEYRQAIRIKPNYTQAYYNLGVALKEQGELDDAVAAYRQAIGIKADHAEAYYNLGNALEGQDKLDEAIAAYRQAIGIKPQYFEAHSNLGVGLAQQGKLRESRTAFERAIQLAPTNANTYRLLADVKRFCANDLHLAAMEKLARDMASLSPQEQTNLHFALAKAYADLEDHARSFHHMVEGNALKRQRVEYDEQSTLAMFDRIRSVFSPELMRDKQACGHASSVPVFIVGMPRSGTTLIEQILASHPKVFGAGELKELVKAMRSLSSPNDAAMHFPEAVSSMLDDQLRQVGVNYVSAISALAPGADRIVDKMPGNFRFAGLIHLAMPNARIIHTRRDPLDTCLSCFSKLFANGHLYSYNLTELARYYRAYQMLMEHWRRVLPPRVMLEVQYEQLTADFESEARRIVCHCGLEWDAACLSFHDTERPVRTASAVQVRQPIYRTSVGRWRVYEHLLGPLVEELGVDVAGSSRC